MTIPGMQPYAPTSLYPAVQQAAVQEQQAPIQEDNTAPEQAAPAQSAPAVSATAAPAPAAAPVSDVSPTELSEQMSYSSTAQQASVSNSTNAADLYGFYNQYIYSAAGNEFARIDTDSNGVWGAEELTAYADAYSAATGRTLDVGALMAQYGVDDGSGNTVIKYQGQMQMYQDDALGISYARDAVLMADYNLSTSASPSNATINQGALNEFVDNYTYGSAGKLYSSMDKNEDGVWTFDELTDYAASYQKATGITLDVESIFAKYDANGDGMIKYAEQNAMYKDDALGLSVVADAMRSGASGTQQAAASPSAASTSSTADLYRFYNQYIYSAAGKQYAKIDTDSDGVWSKDELTAYADAYQDTTGRTLDVDALMEKYGVDNGSGDKVIKYQGQMDMYNDDALGISRVHQDKLLADYNLSTAGSGSTGNTGGSGSTNINQGALNDFINKFTYGSANKLYAKIDHNEDGVWTFDELTEYATAYYKATGVKLDVESIFAKYDTNGDGMIKYAEQNAMYKDDALGLSRISDAMKSAAADGSSTGSTGNKGNDALTDKIRDAASSLSGSQKKQVVQAFEQSMQKAALLDAFMMTNSFIYSRGYGYGYNTNSLWNAGRMAMMNVFI